MFAQTNEAAQVQWMRASEVLMTAGRALLLTRMLADRHALAEQLPRVVPTALRPLLVWMATAAVEHLMRKYAVRNQRVEQHEALARSVLLQLRRGLADGPEHLLSGRLTYSDITMAAALQFVQPVADRYIALGPATRGVWTHPTFANEHGDLLAWRDRLYERHRHRVMALAAPD